MILKVVKTILKHKQRSTSITTTRKHHKLNIGVWVSNKDNIYWWSLRRCWSHREDVGAAASSPLRIPSWRFPFQGRLSTVLRLLTLGFIAVWKKTHLHGPCNACEAVHRRPRASPSGYSETRYEALNRTAVDVLNGVIVCNVCKVMLLNRVSHYLYVWTKWSLKLTTKMYHSSCTKAYPAHCKWGQANTR